MSKCKGTGYALNENEALKKTKRKRNSSSGCRIFELLILPETSGFLFTRTPLLYPACLVYLFSKLFVIFLSYFILSH